MMVQVGYRYNAETDEIELVDGREVVGTLSRNTVIAMVGMFPANPPAREKTDVVPSLS